MILDNRKINSATKDYEISYDDGYYYEEMNATSQRMYIALSRVLDSLIKVGKIKENLSEYAKTEITSAIQHLIDSKQISNVRINTVKSNASISIVVEYRNESTKQTVNMEFK